MLALHCCSIQVLHRLTNDSSLAWSAAEHAPDHPRCLCSLPAVDARRHPTQRARRRGAFDVYSRYTCSLYGGMRIEMPASFVVTFCRRGDSDHVFQSPSQITVDRYCGGRIGIGGDTQTDTSYSPIL